MAWKENNLVPIKPIFTEYLMYIDVKLGCSRNVKRKVSCGSSSQPWSPFTTAVQLCPKPASLIHRTKVLEETTLPTVQHGDHLWASHLSPVGLLQKQTLRGFKGKELIWEVIPGIPRRGAGK